MKRKINICFILLILLLSVVTFCSCSKKSYLDKDSSTDTKLEDNSSNSSKSNSSKDTKDKTANSSGKCFVQVVGAVNKPGVYELEGDARIFQAILMAGGLREDADESNLNQAQKVSDGMKLEIRTRDEAMAAQQNDASDNKVDINTADAKTLMTLPGIGESKANSIIKYRESKGRFNSIEDLKNITGIKEGVYNKVADSIKV